MRDKAELTMTAQRVEGLIHVVRGQRVILDVDLARLYEVTVGALNQAVKRNPARFPDDFAFQLAPQEAANLKSQIVISSWGGRRSPPWVFTEQGIAMLSSVLKSEKAAMVNVAIMRAFVNLRRLLATPGELALQIAKLAETVDFHDDQIKSITEVLRQMMAEPPKPREMGFHTVEITLQKIGVDACQQHRNFLKALRRVRDLWFLSLVAERPPNVVVGFHPSAAAEPSRQTISSRSDA